MVPKTNATAQRLRSFDEKIAFHQHNAISNDLNELIQESSSSSSDIKISAVSSLSASSSSLNLTASLNVSSEEYSICQVQFKHLFRNYKIVISDFDISIGEFVIVQSFVDKKLEDMGVVTQVYSREEFDAITFAMGPSDDVDENKVGKILRIATVEERQYLPLKLEKERLLLHACKEFVFHNRIPMDLYGVEYQFDGNVLFIYYTSLDRVDFRPLVRFLLKLYCKGTRINMKRTNLCRPFLPFPFASYALTSGNIGTKS